VDKLKQENRFNAFNSYFRHPILSQSMDEKVNFDPRCSISILSMKSDILLKKKSLKKILLYHFFFGKCYK
jgi:hypothetical protein